MLLTSVDFLMCLGWHINSIPAVHAKDDYKRLTISSCTYRFRSEKGNTHLVEYRRRSPSDDFAPVRPCHSPLSQPWLVKNRWKPLVYVKSSAPFLSFLFYSLLILLLYLLLQTRPNQQYLNTTNDHRGFSTEFLLVDIDNSVSSLRVLSEMRRKSELWFSTCPLPGTVLDWRIDYSLITEL